MLVLVIRDFSGKIISKFNDRYNLIETHEYLFEILDEGNKLDGQLVIDTGIKENGDPKSIELNYKTKPFLNCLGIFSLSYNGEEVSIVNVVTKKMNSYEAELLFQYVYDNAQELINTFLNKQRRFGSFLSDVTNLHLLSFISVITDLVSVLLKNYHSISSKPIFKLNKRIATSNFGKVKISPKSIEWILHNIDELYISNINVAVPDSFKIGHFYATLNSIESEVNDINTDVYENRIIMGAIDLLRSKISQIEENLLQKLKSKSEYQDYASFDSLKKIVLRTEINAIERIKNTFYTVSNYYKNTFPDVVPTMQIPKLSHNFLRQKAYFDVFQKICLLHKSKLAFSGLNIVLGIKNLDELYELYSFFLIVNEFRNLLGDPLEINHNRNGKIENVLFQDEGKLFRIYYQHNILPYDSLCVNNGCKIFVNSSTSEYLTPDIMIEKIEDKTYSYSILDAKYSSRMWLKGSKKTICNKALSVIGKYYFSVAFYLDKYKRVDHLYLLFPDRGDIIYYTSENKKNYFPVIGAIPCIPGNDSSLRDTIQHLCFHWK